MAWIKQTGKLNNRPDMVSSGNTARTFHIEKILHTRMLSLVTNKPHLTITSESSANVRDCTRTVDASQTDKTARFWGCFALPAFIKTAETGSTHVANVLKFSWQRLKGGLRSLVEGELIDWMLALNCHAESFGFLSPPFCDLRSLHMARKAAFGMIQGQLQI